MLTSSLLNVRWFGAKGDGATDDTAAFTSALATGGVVYVPYGNYKISSEITLTEGGLVGEGWGTAGGALKAVLTFYNLTSATSAAIKTRQASSVGAAVRLENLVIQASSWNGSTGCLGYGLDIEARVIIRNVAVQSFGSHGAIFHHNAGGTLGPYDSLIENIYVVYSGGNGILIGSGANTMTFVNPQCKWNGATAFNTAVAVPGNYDGFVVTGTVTTYPAYTPDQVSIIGGDCSYNSRYGWNFDAMHGTSCSPGYAEGNLTGQARVNDITYCDIAFTSLNGDEAGLTIATATVANFKTNRLKVGGFAAHPVSGGNAYNYLTSLEGAIGLTVLTTAGGLLIYWANMATPDGAVATEAAYGALRGSGAYAFGIGSGARHLKVSDGVIALPDLYYQSIDATGWTGVKRRIVSDSAAPVAGAWIVNDEVINNTPTAGAYKGWVCITAGTPGTWKGYGLIEV